MFIPTKNKNIGGDMLATLKDFLGEYYCVRSRRGWPALWVAYETCGSVCACRSFINGFTFKISFLNRLLSHCATAGRAPHKQNSKQRLPSGVTRFNLNNSSDSVIPRHLRMDAIHAHVQAKTLAKSHP